jgi:hypothetical protein
MKSTKNPQSATLLIHALLMLALLPAVANAQRAELRKEASFCREVKGAECLDDPKFDGVINDVKYRHFGDGSGSVQASTTSELNPFGSLSAWEIACTKNVISGAKFCTISYANFRLLVDPKGNPRVWLHGAEEAYPGSISSIRVGNKLFRTKADEFFPNGRAITGAMTNGVEMATEYVGWPYKNSVASLIPELYGFQEALQLATWSVKNLK